jgi:hypothetical protein
MSLMDKFKVGDIVYQINYLQDGLNKCKVVTVLPYTLKIIDMGNSFGAEWTIRGKKKTDEIFLTESEGVKAIVEIRKNRVEYFKRKIESEEFEIGKLGIFFKEKGIISERHE